VYRALRRRAGHYLNAFPALKRALRRIERRLIPGLPDELATLPTPGPAIDLVRAPRVDRVLRDLRRERRRRGMSATSAR
jgi:hypothetical protein